MAYLRIDWIKPLFQKLKWLLKEGNIICIFPDIQSNVIVLCSVWLTLASVTLSEYCEQLHSVAHVYATVTVEEHYIGF